MFLFFLLSLCTAWVTSQGNNKRQKATTNSIRDEKGEAKLPFLTRFASSHIKGPTMCGDTAQTFTLLCVRILSLAEPLLRVKFLSSHSSVISSPGNKCKLVKPCCKVSNFPEPLSNMWCPNLDYLICQLTLAI